MYSTSHREVGEHNDRVRLEVGVEFFGCHPEPEPPTRDGYIKFLPRIGIFL